MFFFSQHPSGRSDRCASPPPRGGERRRQRNVTPKVKDFHNGHCSWTSVWALVPPGGRVEICSACILEPKRIGRAVFLFFFVGGGSNCKNRRSKFLSSVPLITISTFKKTWLEARWHDDDFFVFYESLKTRPAQKQDAKMFPCVDGEERKGVSPASESIGPTV